MMTTHQILDALQRSPVAHAISKSHHLVGAALQVVHIIGFVALLAAAAFLVLRAVGVLLPRHDLPTLQREMARILWIGLALTVGSGLLMFVSAPKLYWYNEVFEAKLVLLVLAIAAQWLVFGRVLRLWPGTRVAALSMSVSALLWFAVGIAGRGIGFV
jgi:hypothetical protein